MPRPRFDHYYRFDDLTDLLEGIQRENPEIVQVSSIGKSHEGRDIWIVTVTLGGSHSEKPAFWADGNIHASEVSASSAVMKILDKLVRGFQAREPAIVKLLQERTFYLVPRFNPDGAEWALEEPPRIIRSSTRPYPYD